MGTNHGAGDTKHFRSRNPYVVLGVPQTATRGEIKAAWSRWVRLYHPDRQGQPGASRVAADTALARYQAVNKAWEKLRSPEGRAAVDAGLAAVEARKREAAERAEREAKARAARAAVEQARRERAAAEAAAREAAARHRAFGDAPKVRKRKAEDEKRQAGVRGPPVELDDPWEIPPAPPPPPLTGGASTDAVGGRTLLDRLTQAAEHLAWRYGAPQQGVADYLARFAGRAAAGAPRSADAVDVILQDGTVLTLDLREVEFPEIE